MRYSDEELFNVTSQDWYIILNRECTPIEFFEWCINRLKWVIKESLKADDWMKQSHLLNYRIKSIRFYERKLGL